MSSVRLSPIVLRHARTSIRKSQDEAANSLSIKKDELIKLESSVDLVNVSYPFLKRLSKVYKRPLAFFLLHTIPVNLEPENDFRTLESIKINDFDTQMALVLRSAQNTRRKYAKLLSDLDIDHSVSLPKLDIHQSPVSQAALLRDAIGIDIRTQLRWPTINYLHTRYRWCEAIESKGVLVLSHTFDVEAIRGFALSGHSLPPAIVYNSQDDHRASIFTIIHELAHILLCNAQNSSHKEVEAFCNSVAANFLVPESSIRSNQRYEKLLISIPLIANDDKSFDFWITRLASQYKVSRQVILRRAHDLGAINIGLYQAKYNEYKIDYSEITRKKELQKQKRKEAGLSSGGESVSSKVVRNNGSTFTRTVIEALNTSRLTNFQAAEYFGRIKAVHLTGVEEVFSKRYG